jgi:hypothetical protein
VVWLSEAVTGEVTGIAVGEGLEEAKSLLATTIGQILNIIRTIVGTVITYVMDFWNRFLRYTGEHPLGMLLTVSNIIIWVS